jgi:transcriptional regulator with XRE-family HTH domain
VPAGTIYTPAHRRLVAVLRQERERTGLTQAAVAKRLRRPQSFVAKYESGQRRLDLIELEAICKALDRDLLTVIRRYLKQ